MKELKDRTDKILIFKLMYKYKVLKRIEKAEILKKEGKKLKRLQAKSLKEKEATINAIEIIKGLLKERDIDGEYNEEIFKIRENKIRFILRNQRSGLKKMRKYFKQKPNSGIELTKEGIVKSKKIAKYTKEIKYIEKILDMPEPEVQVNQSTEELNVTLTKLKAKKKRERKINEYLKKRERLGIFIEEKEELESDISDEENEDESINFGGSDEEIVLLKLILKKKRKLEAKH